MDRLVEAEEFGITEESEYILRALGKLEDEDLLRDLLDSTISRRTDIRSLVSEKMEEEGIV